MGMCSREQWWVTCDHPGCFESTDNGDIPESEDQATRSAKAYGFVSIYDPKTCDRSWFCEEHDPNRKSDESEVA